MNGESLHHHDCRERHQISRKTLSPMGTISEVQDIAMELIMEFEA